MLRKIAGLGILIAVISVVGCKKQAGEGAQSSTEIPIGQYASLTGGTASFGTMTDNGLELAIEQVNNSGGVLGKKLHLYTEDDASDASQAVTAVQKLVNGDGVVAVIGEVASKRSLAGGGICQQAHIPMISPSSTNPKVTVDDQGQVRKYIFRICFTDTSQGLVDGEFALEQGWKNVAMLTNSEEDYSRGLADSFKKSYGAKGHICEEATYNNSAVDFQAQLEKIKSQNPDAVYVPGYYTEVLLMLPQAKQLGLNVPFFGGDGWDSADTLKLPAAQGDYYSDHFTAEDSRPEVQAFVKAYRAKYNNADPDAMAVLGYDAGMVLVDAIKRAGSADPEAITAALAQTKNYPGASGVITIDADHNAQKTIYMLQIKDQKAVLAKAYPPK
jgi:branched-chain amino acid transport system substrate-binding protein